MDGSLQWSSQWPANIEDCSFEEWELMTELNIIPRSADMPAVLTLAIRHFRTRAPSPKGRAWGFHGPLGGVQTIVRLSPRRGPPSFGRLGHADVGRPDRKPAKRARTAPPAATPLAAVPPASTPCAATPPTTTPSAAAQPVAAQPNATPPAATPRGAAN